MHARPRVLSLVPIAASNALWLGCGSARSYLNQRKLLRWGFFSYLLTAMLSFSSGPWGSLSTYA